MTTDDPLASLASGVAVATGAFSVDRDKAREKLRHFQLADPCAWLLEAVRAAVVMGASAVDVEIDADDVHVRFIDGTAFARKDVDEIYAALLAKNAPPARQHLAVALNAAMALGPKYVKLTTGPMEGVVLEMRPNQSDTITPFVARGMQRVNATTHIHVRHPFRAVAFVEMFKSMTGTKREMQALRQACADLFIPVIVNGRRLPHNEPSADEHAIGVGRMGRRDTPDGSIYGWVRLDRTPEEGGGRVHVLHRGVLLEVLRHELLPDNITAVVEPVGLGRDVSLNAYRRGPEFAAMLDAVLTKALEVSEGPASRPLAMMAMRMATRAFGDSVLDAELGRFAFDGLPNLATALLRRDRPLRNAPTFVDVRGEPVSLNVLCAEVAKRERVLVAIRPPAMPITPDALIVHARSIDEESLIKLVLGDRAEDAEPYLRAHEDRARQRSRFAARRGPTALAPGRWWLARRAGAGRSTFAQGVRFDLGMRASGPAGLETTIFVDGCLACTKVLQWPFTGFSLAIEGRFALNDACDDITVDDAFICALREVWQEIPALLADAVTAELAQPPTPVPSVGRQALVDHAVVMLGWALDAEGLWRTFVTNIAEQCKVTITPLLALSFPELPPLTLAGKRAHVVTKLPLLRRADGGKALTALADLPKPIPVVPWEVMRCSTPEAIRASPVLRRVLELVGPLEVLDGRARRENRLAQLKETHPVLQMPRDGFSFSLPRGDDGGERTEAQGVLRVGTAPGLLIEVRVEGRELAVLPSSTAPIGPLAAIIEDPQVMPLEDGGISSEDRRRYVLASLRALPSFLTHTTRETARLRSLTLTMCGLLFPSLALRRAADVLGIAEYLALLDLLLTQSMNDVSATVELVMEAGERPTLSAVARFAADAGSPLTPAAAPDAANALEGGAWAFEQRLAPFGGIEELTRVAARLADKSIAALLFECVPAIAALAFRTLDMRKVTAQDLASGATSTISYVEREVAGGSDGDGVLVLSPDERTAIANIVGIGRLVDVTEQLRAAAARRLFENREVERAKLDIGNYPIVSDMHEGKVIGQVGLLPLRTHAATTASVRVLRGGRTVVRQDLSSGAPCSFAAVIDDPELRMNADFSAPAAPGDIARLFSMCIAAAEQAVITAAAQYEKHGGEDLRRIVLERLARTSESTLTLKAKRGLASTKIFDTVAREGASAEEIADPPRASVFDAKAGVVEGQLFYVERRPKKRVAMNLVLVLPSSTERTLAASAIGARLVDVSQQWDREDRLRTTRASLPPLLPVPDDALVVAKGSAGRSTLHAWLTASARAPAVHAGNDGLLVRTVAFDVPLPSFTATLSGPDVVDGEWRTVNIDCARNELENAAVELGHALLARVEKQPLNEDTDEAIRLLRAARALICALALQRTRLDPRWALVISKAMAARIFPISGGAHISLEHALAERPPSLERFLIEQGFAAPPAHVVEAQTDEVLASMSDHLDRLHVAPEPVDIIVAPPPAPEIELSSRISETMSLVKLERDAEVELARWPVVVKKNGNKKGLVTFDKQSTLVDADHPLASAALADDADPAALFMLSAVVYGAINAHLGEVTDDHERAFLARLIDHARTVRQS